MDPNEAPRESQLHCDLNDDGDDDARQFQGTHKTFPPQTMIENQVGIWKMLPTAIHQTPHPRFLFEGSLETFFGDPISSINCTDLIIVPPSQRREKKAT